MKRTTTKELPSLPGVYIFKDAQNAIIYIGKAKSIKKRVASYFLAQNNDWKVKALIEEHVVIEHIVTHTEHEALLLEAQLIKQYQPKYNVLLKSGNPFLYLLFTNEETAQFKIVRTKKEKGTYFGPFIQKSDARAAYDYLMRTFKLYRCNKTIPNGCLDFHLGRCAGNCTQEFNEQAYKIQIELAQQALAGNQKEFLETAEKQMREYSARHEFEKAQRLNDYIKNLDTIFAVIKARFTERKYAREVAHVTMPESEQIDIKSMEQHDALIELQELLELPTTPATIDCFDISHFQSTYIVGSCVRFTEGKPEKNKFRRFKIKTLTEQNDYAALQEIVARRYRHNDFPDIILIDGGKGQLSAVTPLFPHTTIISLAKREETVYAANLPQGHKLDLQTPMGRLLIAIRDYAHHFAISYHKLLRKKNFPQ